MHRTGGLSHGRRRGGARAPPPPHQAGHAAADNNPYGRQSQGPPGAAGPPDGSQERGISTVGRPENPALGATQGGARCGIRRKGGLSRGRQRDGAGVRSSVPPPTPRCAHQPRPERAACHVPPSQPAVHKTATAGACKRSSVPRPALACAKQPRRGRAACHMCPSYGYKV